MYAHLLATYINYYYYMIGCPLQVSYTSISSVFAADKISYPRYFRLVPSSGQFADIIVAIVNNLKWKRVAMITHATYFLLGVSIKSPLPIYVVNWLFTTDLRGLLQH